MTAKELVSRFSSLQPEGWKDYAYQMKIAKDLVSTYEDEELIYALQLYKDKIYSLGFLNETNMIRVKQKLKDTVQIKYEVGGDIAQRNRNKLQRFTPVTRFREGTYFDMLKE